MSRSAFVTHPTLERMPGRPARWPVVVGTAAAVLVVSAVLARPPLPPPPGEPPQAVMRIPAWYLQPQPMQVAQTATLERVASASLRRPTPKPAPRLARLTAKPRPQTVASAAPAPGEQTTTAGLEGLF